MKKFICSSLLLVVTFLQLNAQPLVFDNSFGTSGMHKAPISGNYNGYADMKILADQKIICLGMKGTSDTTSQAFFAKYNTNGTLDNTFGTNGISTFLGSGNTSLSISRFAIQADGKIVFGVEEYINGSNSSTQKIVRYNSNGTIDNTFGTSGTASINYASFGYVNSVDVQTDGKILACVEASWDSSYIVRVLSNGTIDNTFGTSGFVKIPSTSATDGKSFSCIKALSDGSILVGGYRNISGTVNVKELYIYKYNNSGILDNTFGTNGVFTYNENNKNIYGNYIALQSNNKIIIGGQIEGTPNSNAFLIRCNANGTIDNTFGNNGIAKYTEANLDCSVTTRCAITADDKITCSIDKTNSNGDESLSIVRFNANGTLDNTLNNGQAFRSITELPNVVIEDIAAVDVQADGKIVFIATETDASFTNFNGVIGRLQPQSAAAINTVNNSNGFSIAPNPANESIIISNSTNADVLVTIFNIQGNAVYQQAINTAEKINTSKLASGIYTIKIQSSKVQNSLLLEVKH